MAGKIELEDDIDIKLGVPAYYPIPGEEVPDISAKPYFIRISSTEVNLKRYDDTILVFKVGGRAKRKIWGQVTRPDDRKSPTFVIKAGNSQASGKAEVLGKVVIKQPNGGAVDHLRGYWYLTIWYGNATSDVASERWTVWLNEVVPSDNSGWFGWCSIL